VSREAGLHTFYSKSPFAALVTVILSKNERCGAKNAQRMSIARNTVTSECGNAPSSI
jgi:hypothetical protein